MRNYILWHPDSPGVRLFVGSPCLLRRLGIIRSEFATLGEARNKHTSYMLPLADSSIMKDTLDRTRPVG